MSDLSHWEFAERFSGYDAAALILGIEPRESEMEEFRVRVVSDRMAHDYKNALNKSFHDFLGNPLEPLNPGHDDSIIELVSVQLKKLSHRYFLYDEETPYSDWFANSHKSAFDSQEFSRQTIVDWLISTGMKSVYRFDRGQANACLTKKPAGHGGRTTP